MLLVPAAGRNASLVEGGALETKQIPPAKAASL